MALGLGLILLLAILKWRWPRAPVALFATVIIDMESSQLMDITGADALERIYDRARADGIRLKLCRVRMAVLGVLQHTGLLNDIGEQNLYPSIRSAAEAAVEEK